MNHIRALPPALTSRNPLQWLTVFGPGAIMASLTIGTGELIFSSRGGALFGYRILFLFIVISLLKWVLVYSAARHMVLTGIHPLERWVRLPGPRGWLPAIMFIFAVLCIPIWVSFHASVLGDMLAGLSDTKQHLNGASIHLWGLGMLLLILVIAFRGGYEALERIQLVVVTLMLVAMFIALTLLKPDWIQIILGAVIPRPLNYPDWVLQDSRPLLQKIAATPVWVEASLYVSVIGGASYDYLAYTSFLRHKGWGAAGVGSDFRLEPEQLELSRPWLRAPLIDCAISFSVVILFSAVFVASGTMVLSPQRQIPGDGSFLEHQSQFITQLHPWLFPLYVAGTLLTMLGTLYGTLEVAPTVLAETMRLVRTTADPDRTQRRSRLAALGWCGGGAIVVLIISFFYQRTSGADRPPGLTSLLTPAGLFTGVLSCGFICFLNPWMDRNLPPQYRMHWTLACANIIGGVVFFSLGLRAYWQLGGLKAMALLLATCGIGWVIAMIMQPYLRADQS